jgi:hypothetical protein
VAHPCLSSSCSDARLPFLCDVEAALPKACVHMRRLAVRRSILIRTQPSLAAAEVGARSGACAERCLHKGSRMGKRRDDGAEGTEEVGTLAHALLEVGEARVPAKSAALSCFYDYTASCMPSQALHNCNLRTEQSPRRPRSFLLLGHQTCKQSAAPLPKERRT